MRTYYFNYEFFVPSRGTIEVEAGSMLEAIEKAREIDIYDEGEFLCDFDASTDTRLYSIDCDEGEIARIEVPEALNLWSWTAIDLMEQLDRLGGVELEQPDAGQFDRAVHQYCVGLRPKLSGEVHAEMEAQKLRMTTVMSTGAAAVMRI